MSIKYHSLQIRPHHYPTPDVASGWAFGYSAQYCTNPSIEGPSGESGRFNFYTDTYDASQVEGLEHSILNDFINKIHRWTQSTLPPEEIIGRANDDTGNPVYPIFSPLILTPESQCQPA